MARLGLAVTRGGRIALADGTVQQCDVCAAEVWWDGRWRQVQAYVVGRDEVLVGMRLLAGHELRIEVRPGGDVEVRPLP